MQRKQPGTKTPSQAGATTRPSRHQARKAKSRARLMAAARATFTRRGFAATRIEDITAAARTAKGTFYLHFTDKGDIFAALAQDLLGAVETDLAASRLASGDQHLGPDRAQALLAAEILAVLSHFSSNHDLARVLLHEARLQDARLEARLDLFFGRMARHIQGGIRSLSLAGLARPVDAKLAAQAVIGMIERVALNVIPSRCTRARLSSVARALAHLEAGMLLDRPPGRSPA